VIFLLVVLVALVAWIAFAVQGSLRGIERELTTIRQFLQSDPSYASISLPAHSVAYLQNISSYVSRLREEKSGP
jgi:hypothetical protein